VAERHGTSNLRVFGSVARGEDGPDSAADLLADLAPDVSLFTLARLLQRELEQILGVSVDLVPSDGPKPALRGAVRATQVPLWTRHEQQRLDDITAAIGAIRNHLTRSGLTDGLVFDAVLVRLIEVEAVTVPS
jgi:predicted nucleotidyltransferase